MVEKGIGEKQGGRSTKCLRKLSDRMGVRESPCPGRFRKAEGVVGRRTRDGPGLLRDLKEGVENVVRRAEREEFVQSWKVSPAVLPNFYI